MGRRLCCTAALAVTGCVLIASRAPAEAPWSQWRGPSRDGFVAAATPWPDSLDRATGRELWQVSWEGAMQVPFFAASNGSWIRSTPCADDGRVYVAGMRDVLVCLDAANGREIWRIDFTKDLESPLPAFGFVSSPLVIGDHVFVQAGAGFVKLDKATGKVVWRVLEDGGGMWGSAFSSPYPATPEKYDLLGEAKVAAGESWAHLAVEGDELFVRDLEGLTVLRWK